MAKSNLEITRHARRRMKWRRITEEDVRATIDEPDKTEESVSGRKNVYKEIGVRYIKVTYREIANKLVVISAVDKGKGEMR